MKREFIFIYLQDLHHNMWKTILHHVNFFPLSLYFQFYNVYPGLLKVICLGRKDYSGSLLPWIIFFLNNVLVIEQDFQTVNHLHVYHLLHIITLSTNQKRNPEFYIYNFFSNRVVTDVAHGPLACSCQKKNPMKSCLRNSNL